MADDRAPGPSRGRKGRWQDVPSFVTALRRLFGRNHHNPSLAELKDAKERLYELETRVEMMKEGSREHD